MSNPRRLVVRLPRTVDVSFPALGSIVRLIAGGPSAARAVARSRAEVLDYHRRLSRFLPASELCALNADPRRAVPASRLLRSAVRAGLWAATLSDGLVDPCLLGALEAAGYDRSYEPTARLPPPSGPRRPARPDPSSRWREIRVDETAGTVRRPRGIRLDLGGSGKGHIADLLSRHFERCQDWVVDCGGDIRVGAARTIEIAHPLDVRRAARLHLGPGAVATSSVVSRAWLRGDGARAHHLLDPSTGEPVWTGLLSATAVAPTTLHAETLAKIAVLTGGDAARAALAGHGGVLVHEGGAVEVVEPDVEFAA